MKFIIAISFLVSSSFIFDAESFQTVETKLAPCPNSPNCVSTQETRRIKKMQAIPFSGSSIAIINELEKMLGSYENTTLIEKDGNYMHFEFLTRIGNFIDDVEFLIDDKDKVIHFRSASREGYGDFGKNKRRMKMIVKDWEKRIGN